MSPLHTKIHWNKFGWNWSSGSREKDFFPLINYRNLLIFLALCSLLHILWLDLFTCAIFNTFCDLTYLLVQPFIFLRLDLFTYAAFYMFCDETYLPVQPITSSETWPFLHALSWPVYLCSLLHVLRFLPNYLYSLLQFLQLDLFTCAAFYMFCNLTYFYRLCVLTYLPVQPFTRSATLLLHFVAFSVECSVDSFQPAFW